MKSRTFPQRVREIQHRLLTDADEESGVSRGDLRRLAREYLRPHVWVLLAILALMALWAMTPFGFAATHKFLVDGVLADVPVPRGTPQWDRLVQGVLRVFWVNIAIHTVSLVCHWSTSYLMLGLAQKLAFALRGRLHRKLDRLHLGFHERIQTGRILSRMQHDVGVIQNNVGLHLHQVVIEPLKLVVALAVLFWLNSRLTLIVCVGLPFYALAFLLLRPPTKRNSMAQSRLNSRMYGLAAERLGQILLVKAFTQEWRELSRFARMAMEGVRLAIRQPWYSQSLGLSAATVTSIVTFGVLYVGFGDVRDSVVGMTLGALLAYVLLLAQVFQPVQQITHLAWLTQLTLVSLRRVFALLDTPEELSPGGVDLEKVKPRIRFDHVTFSYPNQQRPALEEIDFRVRPGERVAVMGPSGAGKSTLFQLALRFYAPQEGRVRIGGVDLAEVDPVSLRRQVRLVQQEPFLFSGVLRENIAYGRPDATLEEIAEAARLAELDAFIRSLPQGYDTRVGERGVSLSGGQRQRLALATALLTRPRILLLDDCTSALDAQTEARVHATLRRVLHGTTVMMVTHRISAARECDRVLVLEGGRLTQDGTPEELLDTAGFYRRVCEQQHAL